jgi:hypothetical protein
VIIEKSVSIIAAAKLFYFQEAQKIFEHYDINQNN